MFHGASPAYVCHVLAPACAYPNHHHHHRGRRFLLLLLPMISVTGGARETGREVRRDALPTRGQTVFLEGIESRRLSARSHGGQQKQEDEEILTPGGSGVGDAFLSHIPSIHMCMRRGPEEMGQTSRKTV